MDSIFDSKVIILANAMGGTSGYSSRWNKHLGINKHMVPINNIPLIHYTQKQLKHYGFTDIYISCQLKDKESYIINSNNWVKPPDTQNAGAPNNEIIIASTLFSEEKNNIILFGDNFYSILFFEKIFAAQTDKIWMYARKAPSTYINKNFWEPFGWYIPKHETKFIVKCAEDAINEMLTVNKKILPDSAIAQTYSRVITRRGNHGNNAHWIDIDDETTDFDYPKDWDFWSKNVLPQIKLLDFGSNE